MKIKDIFPIDIFEVFQTKIPVDSWKQDSDGDIIGDITIDDVKYQIYLQKSLFRNLSFISISFSVWDDLNKTWSDKPTLTKSNASKIIGAITNAITTELNNHHYDALVFAATDLTDKRMRIYNWIASRYSKQFGCIRQNIQLQDGMLATIICTKQFCDNESVDDVMQELADMRLLK